jgi:glycerophosphoinositol inositolphosphodiesterase
MAIIGILTVLKGGKFFMVAKKTSFNRLKIRVHYLLAFILLLHCALFSIYWIAVGNFRSDVNQFIQQTIGWRLPYVLIIIILSLLIGFWSLIRFLKFRAHLKNGFKPSSRNWIYFCVWVIYLLIFYLSFIIVFQEDPSQMGVAFYLLDYVRIVSDAILFLFLAVWLRILILYFREKTRAAPKKWLWTVGITLSLILLVGFWLLPTLFPPNWAYQGDLPSKPALLAHRGASMLAPENTLAAIELAAEYEAFGFETDLRISKDGVPFLMHDETFARTTNITEVYPVRAIDRVSSFTMEEINSLNAGLWFLQKDPYNTIEKGLVSQSQLGINQGQTIPTLADALELVKEDDLVIMFDMRYPSEGHPYYDEFFNIVLDECRQSELNGNIWFLVDRQQLLHLINEAPQMTRVIGISSTDLPNAKNLSTLQYEMINVDGGILPKSIRSYRQMGLGVNVYTIDQPWLFSQLWLSGVTSITTNNIQSLSTVDKPIINLPYSRYMLFWGLYGIIIAIWLASSQPEQETEKVPKMRTPDLMDFAQDDENTIIPNSTEIESHESSTNPKEAKSIPGFESSPDGTSSEIKPDTQETIEPNLNQDTDEEKNEISKSNKAEIDLNENPEDTNSPN